MMKLAQRKNLVEIAAYVLSFGAIAVVFVGYFMQLNEKVLFIEVGICFLGVTLAIVVVTFLALVNMRNLALKDNSTIIQ
jgi:hypothetical protein